MHYTISLPIAAIIALGALPMPYGYYGILRWTATIGFILTAITLYEPKLRLLIIVPIFGAILFNPIYPIYLDKETWAPIDIASAIAIIVLNYLSYKFHTPSEFEKRMMRK